MTLHIDRRQLLSLGTFGIGALAVPAAAQAAAARGFNSGGGGCSYESKRNPGWE